MSCTCELRKVCDWCVERVSGGALRSRSQIKRVLTQEPGAVIQEIEGLRAECERLQKQDAALKQVTMEYERLHASLRAENARLLDHNKQLQISMDNLEASIHRLEENVVFWMEDALKWNKKDQGHRAQLAEAHEALNKIASWSEGETVSGKFDEPGSASEARAYFAKLKK